MHATLQSYTAHTEFYDHTSITQCVLYSAEALLQMWPPLIQLQLQIQVMGPAVQYAQQCPARLLVVSAHLKGFTTSLACRDGDSLKQALDINCIGAHRVTQAFLPLLQSGRRKTVINMSSVGGAFSWNIDMVSSVTATFCYMPCCIAQALGRIVQDVLYCSTYLCEK